MPPQSLQGQLWLEGGHYRAKKITPPPPLPHPTAREEWGKQDVSWGNTLWSQDRGWGDVFWCLKPVLDHWGSERKPKRNFSKKDALHVGKCPLMSSVALEKWSLPWQMVLHVCFWQSVSLPCSWLISHVHKLLCCQLFSSQYSDWIGLLCQRNNCYILGQKNKWQIITNKPLDNKYPSISNRLSSRGSQGSLSNPSWC